MKKAIVLVSGGIDSCVTASIAKQKYELSFLHINYGQRGETKELSAFNKIADFYKIKQKFVCEASWLKKIGGTSLLDKNIVMEQPSGKKLLNYNSDLKLLSSVPTTYVPFRNATFLCIAISWAEVIKASRIFIGAVSQDAPEYPDTRVEFFKAFNELAKFSTFPIKIEIPIVNLTKKAVVKMGLQLGAPLHLTWSCYKGNKVACGKCASCMRRREAFKKAGVKNYARHPKR